MTPDKGREGQDRQASTVTFRPHLAQHVYLDAAPGFVLHITHWTHDDPVREHGYTDAEAHELLWRAGWLAPNPSDAPLLWQGDQA
jgi:hypothetical protein